MTQAGWVIRLQQDRRLQLQRFHDAAAANTGKAVAVVTLALGMHRDIDGQHQRAEPVIAGAPDQRVGDVAVLGGVELKPDIVRYGKLGLPTGAFTSMAVFASPRPGDPQRHGARDRAGDTGVRRSTGRSPSSAGRAAAVPLRRRRGRAPAVHDRRADVAAQLRATPSTATPRRRGADRRHERAHVSPTSSASSSRSCARRPRRRPGPAGPAGPSARARSTPSCVAWPRERHVEHLDPSRHRRRRRARHRPRRQQVTVVDLHKLHDRAKRFVVGVVLRQAFDAKEPGHGRAAAVHRARRAQQVRARAKSRARSRRSSSTSPSGVAASA